MTKLDVPASSGLPASTPNNAGTNPSNACLTSNSNNTGVRTIPRDTSVITSILKDLDIHDYEPRVIHQLLEFTYRYVTTVLEDAQIFSQYANKKTIDVEDVKLAIQLQVERMFTSPPPRDLLMEIARQKNNQPLPSIKSHAGPRLPPDRYSLISCNYRLRPSRQLKLQQQNQSQQQFFQIASPQFTLRSLQTATGTILANIPTKGVSMITLPARASATASPTFNDNMTLVNNSNSENLIISNGNETKSNEPVSEESISIGVKRKLEDSDSFNE